MTSIGALSSPGSAAMVLTEVFTEVSMNSNVLITSVTGVLEVGSPLSSAQHPRHRLLGRIEHRGNGIADGGGDLGQLVVGQRRRGPFRCRGHRLGHRGDRAGAGS